MRWRQRIYTCVVRRGQTRIPAESGESGEGIGTAVVDHHLFSLEKRLLLLQEQDIDPDVLIAQEAEEATRSQETKKVVQDAFDEEDDVRGGQGKKGGKGKPTGKSREWCNVCKAGFESRSKLFNHIRETDTLWLASRTARRADASNQHPH